MHRGTAPLGSARWAGGINLAGHRCHIHGITWEDVAGQPAFAEVWPGLGEVLDGAEYLAAHNAPFDKGVLSACCRAADLEPPGLDFVCTLALSRRLWDLRSHALPSVCRHLGIPLQHHDPTSDAEACARQATRTAAARGARLRQHRPGCTESRHESVSEVHAGIMRVRERFTPVLRPRRHGHGGPMTGEGDER